MQTSSEAATSSASSAPPEQAEDQAADRVCRVDAVALQVGPGRVLGDPLVHPVGLDQAQERLPGQVELADRRLELLHHRPRRRAARNRRRPRPRARRAARAGRPRPRRRGCPRAGRTRTRPAGAAGAHAGRGATRPGSSRSARGRRRRRSTPVLDSVCHDPAVRAMVLDRPGQPLRAARAPRSRAGPGSGAASTCARAASAAPTCTSSTASCRDPKLPLVLGPPDRRASTAATALPAWVGVPWLGWT